MALRVRSKFWIEDDQGRPIFGRGRGLILEKIDELGSIRATAMELQMSYRAVWGKIKATEERLGFKLVETSRGGGRGRGARLTPEAKKLLGMFQELHRQGNTLADNLFNRIFVNLT